MEKEDDEKVGFVSSEQFYDGKDYIEQVMSHDNEASDKLDQDSANPLENLSDINNESVKLCMDSYLTPATGDEEFDQEIVISCDISATKKDNTEKRSIHSPLSNADSSDYSLSPRSLNTYVTSDNFAPQLRESPMETSIEFQAFRSTESYSMLPSASEPQNYLISSDYETNSPSLDMSRTYFCVVSPINDSRTIQSKMSSTSSVDNVFQLSQSSSVDDKNCEKEFVKLRKDSSSLSKVTETGVDDFDIDHQTKATLELFEHHHQHQEQQNNSQNNVNSSSKDDVKKLNIDSPLHDSARSCNTLIVDQKLIEQMVNADRQINILDHCHTNNASPCGNSVMIKVQGTETIWQHIPVTTSMPSNALHTSLSSTNNDLIRKYNKSATIHSLDSALASTQPYLQVALVNDLDSTAPVDLVSTNQILGSVMSDMFMCQWEACTLHFISIDDLVKHINNIHITSENKYSFKCLWKGCVRQGKPFDARYKMVIHMRTHTGEKPHVCPVKDCEASFARLENLKIHRRSHTGEKPYVCQVPGCDRSFANSSDRFKHKRTHDMKKPFKCSVSGCGKCYTDPSSLRKHRKRHQADRLKEYGDSVFICEKVSVHAPSMV